MLFLAGHFGWTGEGGGGVAANQRSTEADLEAKWLSSRRSVVVDDAMPFQYALATSLKYLKSSSFKSGPKNIESEGLRAAK